jgi:hypothetical protein
LALVVKDEALVTVVPFKDYAGSQKLPQKTKSQPTVAADTVVKAILKSVRENDFSKEVSRSVLGQLIKRPLEGPGCEDAIELYAEDRISFDELNEFLGMKHKHRERELHFYKCRKKVGV